MMEPRNFLLIGFVLLLLGFLIPFLTVLQLIPSNFLFLFFSYGASTVGLVLGFIGIAYYVRRNRK